MLATTCLFCTYTRHYTEYSRIE